MTEKSSIILIGSDKMNAFVIKQSLGNDYNIIVCSDVNESLIKLEGLEEKVFSIICCDFNLSDETLAFVEWFNESEYFDMIPLIMLMPRKKCETNAEKCYNLGFSEVIEIPFDPYYLKTKMNTMQRLYSHCKNMQKKMASSDSSQMDIIINILSTAFELIRFESSSHISRVKEMTNILTVAFADEYTSYGLEDDDIKYITLASALHDLGKAKIPTEILFKSAKLTEAEEKIMRTHTIKGAEILREFGLDNSHKFYSYAFDICRYHHERWDGKGYPFQLEKEQIPVSAQIVSLADVYDTVVFEKVAKGFITYKKAVRGIREGYYGKFSPQMLNIFTKCEPVFKDYIRNFIDENIVL